MTARAPVPGLSFEGSVFADARTGARRLLGPLSLTVAARRWTCLLGPSGVGKSTLLQAFTGLPDGLRMDGSAVLDTGTQPLGQVALMAQDAGLLPWLSALQNVWIGSRLRGERPDHARAKALLEQVGLGAQGAQNCTRLSGGQQQRLALARTLYEDRPVVLLDEPFSALDVATRLRVQDVARDLLRGRTVLHVTHDPAEAARIADDILILDHSGLTPVSVPQHSKQADDPQVQALTADLTRLLLEAA